MALVEGKEYPEHLYYDLENQMWYEPLDDGTVRTGFTPVAMDLAGEILVFTPKRIGHRFEVQRSFAIIEGGKWVGAAHAAFAAAPSWAAQHRSVRRGLDANRPARGRELAHWSSDRPGNRTSLLSMAGGRSI